MNHRDDIKLEL